jgi:large subunit ribosomal protein L15e
MAIQDGVGRASEGNGRLTREVFLSQDPRINWIVNPVHKHRELRGLTAAGKTYRGLRTKGHGANKLRPSVRATWKRNNSKSMLRYR